MNIGTKALQVLQTVAPTVALAVGGPFGPIAAAAIHAALGSADDKGAEGQLLAATPDQLIALKKAEQDFQVQMKALGIQEEQLVYTDKASARAREEVVKDSTPMWLAMFVTFGFFAVLGDLLVNGKPTQGGDVMMVMVGSLGTAWTGIVAYYFGSSSGSAAKSDTIAKLATK